MLLKRALISGALFIIPFLLFAQEKAISRRTGYGSSGREYSPECLSRYGRLS